MIRFLVERGLGVNEPNAGGASALSRAISRRYLPTVEFLLAKGATIRKTDLINATHWLEPKLIEKLIAMGADVNARNASFGRTPLINAASSEQAGAATLKLLLEKGADPNIADNDGERALDWAMHRADQAKIDVLKQFGAKDATTPRDKVYPKPDGMADPRQSVARAVALLMPIICACRGSFQRARLHHVPQPDAARSGCSGRERARHPYRRGDCQQEHQADSRRVEADRRVLYARRLSARRRPHGRLRRHGAVRGEISARSYDGSRGAWRCIPADA